MQLNNGQGMMMPDNLNNRQFPQVNQQQVYFELLIIITGFYRPKITKGG